MIYSDNKQHFFANCLYNVPKDFRSTKYSTCLMFSNGSLVLFSVAGCPLREVSTGPLLHQ